MKRYLMAGLMAVIFGVGHFVYAAESDFTMEDNTTSSGFSIKEETTGSTIARFRGDGNVGIATTSPTEKLEVSGNVKATKFIGDGSELTGITGGSGKFVDGTNTNDAVYTSGNVGIGITEPLDDLHIEKSNSAGITIESTSTGDASLFLKTPTSNGLDSFITLTKSGVNEWTFELDASDGLNNFVLRNGANANGTGVLTIEDGAAANTLYLDNAGNVGIGTTAPGVTGWDRSLTISAGSSGIVNGGLEIQGSRSTDAEFGGIDFYNQTNLGVRIAAWRDGAMNSAALGFETVSAGNRTERIRVTSSGNVGIGTTAPTERLHVVGNIVASGTIGPVSSRAFKKDISYVSTKDAMDTLQGLNPVKFRYKEDNSGEEHLGFIAEDVPELVSTQSRNHLSLMDFTAVLTKVVQEQQKMLHDQKKAMDAMAKKIETLESGMNYGVKGL